MKLAFYDDQHDVNPAQVDLSWPELVEALSSFADPRCSLAGESGLSPCQGRTCPAKFGPAWSPVDIDGPRADVNVRSISVAVFDLDHLTAEQFAHVLEAVEGFAGVLHSTHSHSPADPCYRLVLPLDRPCPAADWPKVRRAIVEALRLPADPATKDKSRIYFLPSARAGVTPYVRVFEGDPVILDEALEIAGASPSSLPPAEPPRTYDLGELRKRLSEARRSKAQGNEHAKEQADLLGKVLEGKPLGEVGTRHTARVRVAGLLGYWLPASTPWPVALELLRPCLSATPVADGETFDAAVEKTKKLYESSMAARLISDARKEADAALFRELARATRDRAAAANPTGDPKDLEYEPVELRSGSFAACVRVLREDTADVLGGRKLEYNEMVGGPMLARKELDDGAVSAIRCRIEERIRVPGKKKETFTGLAFSEADVYKASALVSSQAPYHPVREYLQELVWDGEARLARLVPEILGAENNPLNRALVRRWFVSAVARAISPGCKADSMLVLVGPQGTGKSSFFNILASDEWFVDSHLDFESKDAYATLRRAWIVELGELASLRSVRDHERVKAFLTSRIDTYRPPYARSDVRVPRGSIMGGTTNTIEFLVDETGNRRYWPITVGLIEIYVLREWRDQLWAEATAALNAGEDWRLDEQEKAWLEDALTDHETGDDWEAPVLRWMDNPIILGSKTPQPRTTANILRYALDISSVSMGRRESMRVASILRRAGWQKTRPKNNEPRVWVKPRGNLSVVGASE